jgi:hypothetical protein
MSQGHRQQLLVIERACQVVIAMTAKTFDIPPLRTDEEKSQFIRTGIGAQNLSETGAVDHGEIDIYDHQIRNHSEGSLQSLTSVAAGMNGKTAARQGLGDFCKIATGAGK